MPGMQKFLLIVLVVVSIFNVSKAVDSAVLKEKLNAALKTTDDILQKIFDRWQINDYPNFLRAAAMTHTSWEVLKLKFQQKILTSLNGSKTQFVISFTGSSVTAGHDSPFNVTFSQLTGPLMAPAFAPFGVEVISRGVAMGNNPCLPYDVCVRAFAGPDSDIVHWEQSFNCFGTEESKRPVFEQFIRQSLAMPNQPIVVFAESAMPNWEEKECQKEQPAISISDEEKKLLELWKTDPIKISTELNKQDIQRAWSAVIDMFKKYKTAGIQMWHHQHYDVYKCRGPYVAKWGCCSASWHPSLLGHELRAAHHAFFWLLIYKDALKELLSRTDTPDVMLQIITKHIEAEHKYIPSTPVFPSDFSDNLQCYTSFQPLTDPSLSLEKLVIPSGDGKKPFQVKIVEDITNPDQIKMARSRGYRDYRNMLYGDKDSTLSLKIKVQKEGKGFMCQPAGDWGRLPDGFKNFWEVDTKVYITENVESTDGFSFSPDKAKLLPYTNHNPKDTQTICVDFNDKLKSGNHVLTIVPTTDQKIMIAYIIIP